MPDLDTELATLNDDVPDMTDEAFTSGRARLHNAMTGTRQPRRLPVLVAAAASVVALSATVLLVGNDTVPSVNTATQLTEWAKTLADDPPKTGPGQYLYEQIHSVHRTFDNPRKETTSTGEQWIPHDYRDEWRVKVGQEMVRILWPDTPVTSTKPTTTAPVDMTAKCGKFAADDTPCDGEGWGTTGSPAFYAGLTGDADHLYEVITARANSTSDGEIFKQADLLLQPNIPNDFKATLFEAMTKIPGLRISDNAQTMDGRNGISLSVATNGTMREQILDPATGDLIQGRIQDTRTELIGTVTYGVTDSMRTRPN